MTDKKVCSGISLTSAYVSQILRFDNNTNIVCFNLFHLQFETNAIMLRTADTRYTHNKTPGKSQYWEILLELTSVYWKSFVWDAARSAARRQMDFCLKINAIICSLAFRCRRAFFSFSFSFRSFSIFIRRVTKIDDEWCSLDSKIRIKSCGRTETDCRSAVIIFVSKRERKRDEALQTVSFPVIVATVCGSCWQLAHQILNRFEYDFPLKYDDVRVTLIFTCASIAFP